MKQKALQWITNEQRQSPERKNRDATCFFVGCVLAYVVYLAERLISH